MGNNKIGMNDERIDIIIGNILRVAVIISALFVLAGAVIYLSRHGLEAPNYGVFSGVPKNLSGFEKIMESAWNIKSMGIIQLGLLILIFTPVARVAFSVVAFLLERDYMYVIFTLIVLTVLLLSITGVII
jgi:uncharacterized membrane protein